MATEDAKAPARPSGRRYRSVAELLGGEAVSQEVRHKVHLAESETRVVLQLAKLRQIAGLTQEEMARHLNVSQSAISKLESGSDNDLKLGEIRAYVAATQQRVSILLGKPFTHVEAIKLHALAIKARLEKLADLANQNEEMEKDIKAFFGEAFFNLLNILSSCSQQLPNGDHHCDIEVRIERIESSPALNRPGKLDAIRA